MRILYVEDEPVQRKLMAHALSKIPEFACKVDFESTEEGGLRAFRQTPFDAVLVDYQLEQGNGLELIRRLRQFDRVVPIIAVSGVAPAEVAAELVMSGADDYLDKTAMDTKNLAHSLQIAVLRADGMRNRLPPPHPESAIAEVAALCTWLAASGPEALLAQLDRCEIIARATAASPPVLVEWFEAAAIDLGKSLPGGPATARLALRPLLLELMARIDSSLFSSDASVGESATGK